MVKQKGLLTVIGLGAVAVGGYLIYRVTKGKKPDLKNAVVHYTSIADDIPANYIVTELNIQSRLITGTADEILTALAQYKMIITIGGQIANPLYSAAVAQGLVPEITTPGQKVVKSIETAGVVIFFVAGYTASDTFAAAQDFVKQSK
ncbi:hypothetical protein LCGC14_1256690 [marine sediment metagenome]|uniref:Uncharacterized protein n=1 Tax=marine sediment metagenome TaxID=412755 RepID=A0A0F9P5B2_9ZZZZ